MSETPDFESITGVGPATAEKLEDAGYKSYRALATKQASELATETDIGESTCETVIQAARKKADIGGFSSGTEVMERRQKIGKISLLVPEFDELMGGGIETQAMTEIHGGFGAGKSQVTHQLAVNVQLDEEYGGLHNRCVFIDTEDTFRPERIDDMVRGLDEDIIEHELEKRGIGGSADDPDALEALVDSFLDKIHVAKGYNTDHQLLLAENASDVCKENADTDWPVGLICVDSLTAHFRAEFVGRGDLAQRQQKLNTHLFELSSAAKEHNCAILVTNQVMDNPDQMFGNPETPIGGNVLAHEADFRLWIKNSKDNKRIVNLIDAPNLPDGEVVIKVEGEGVKPD